MAACVAALAVASALFAMEDEKTAVRFKISDLSAASEMIGSNSTAALSFRDVSSAKEILRALQARKDVLHACIYDKSGNVFAKYSQDAADAGFVPPPLQPDRAIVAGGHLLLFHRIVLNNETIGSIFLDADFREIPDRMMQFLKVDALVSLLSLSVAFVLASASTASFPVPFKSSPIPPLQSLPRKTMPFAPQKPAMTKSAFSLTNSMECSSVSSCAMSPCAKLTTSSKCVSTSAPANYKKKSPTANKPRPSSSSVLAS